jgi:hypothetical protein
MVAVIVIDLPVGSVGAYCGAVEGNVLIGYMRVSKADGSQVLDLQRDALIAAGVKRSHLYEVQGVEPITGFRLRFRV